MGTLGLLGPDDLMSLYNAMVMAAETVAVCGSRLPPGGLALPSMNPSSLTYFYRTSAGARSSTPFAASVPAGAVVELVVAS